VVLDEVQRAPQLLLAIKAAVDRNPQPGRFLLTSSANILLVPSLFESLAGRMKILTLWPFSQVELTGSPGSFIDAAFSETPPAPPDTTVAPLAPPEAPEDHDTVRQQLHNNLLALGRLFSEPDDRFVEIGQSCLQTMRRSSLT
jgi:predicted AAA+ superfamily ATPase